MLIGVSEHAVYGFAGRSRSKEPTELVFQVLRDNLDVKVINGQTSACSS